MHERAVQLIEGLEDQHSHVLSKSRAPYARSNPIASDLHDCDRYAALSILAWSHKPPIAVAGIEVMDDGRRVEEAVLEQLSREGWKVAEQQSTFEIRSKDKKRVLLRGKIDGVFVLEDRLRVPLEIKSTSFFMFNRLNTEEDLRRGSIWTRKWWRQFQSYLLGHSFEWGVFLLVHRNKRKWIPIELDYGAAEEILQQCERTVTVSEQLGGVDPSLLDSALTEVKVPYLRDPEVCQNCDFLSRVCFPELAFKPEGEITVRPELEEEVARFVELDPLAKEHASLERNVIKKLRGLTILAGQFLVGGTWSSRSMKAQDAKPATTQQVWKRTISRIGGESKP